MKEVTNNKTGLTLVEVLMSTLLIGMVFLAVSALFVASQRFNFSTIDKIRIGYELDYAVEHIYKNVMQGIGDSDNPAVVITEGGNNLQFTLRHIDETDPDAPPTYNDYNDDKEITYEITPAGKLRYVKYDLNTEPEEKLEEDNDMIPRVTLLFEDDPVTGEQLSKFYKVGNLLKIKLTAEFPLARTESGSKERLTLYSACYSRLESYQ